MTALVQTPAEFGADPSAIRLFDEISGPELLPYVTLLAARKAGDSDLDAVGGVYEWQDAPLMFLIDAAEIGDDLDRLSRVRRLVAMRGDAPYLGVVAPGRLDVYSVSLDAKRATQARIALPVDDGGKPATFALLANDRPGVPRNQRKLISQVVLNLLEHSIEELTNGCDVNGEDAISLVGRALFIRFLGDRDLMPLQHGSEAGVAELFDDAARGRKTSDWLDETFNGDFLPLTPGLFDRLPEPAFHTLGNILRRAPGGQLFLGWEERWDHLHFAHIPVGVLSQAYQGYLKKHSSDQQRREGGYYTPRHIADLMVRGAFHALSQEMEVSEARVLDPAAGAGVFLLTAFRQLVAARWRRDETRPGTGVLRDILYNQISGFDVNEAALRFAALGLYLLSIELDPAPEPVGKLRFREMRGTILHKVGSPHEDAARPLGSLGAGVGEEHRGAYDLVIGNPPWTGGTRLPSWSTVKQIVARIARERLPDETSAPLLPNEVLDLPFLWRAMEWAGPGRQIALALHARLLFQQGDGMPEARRMLFRALDVSGVVNGAELRQSNVWPGIAAPFCLLFARNRVPPPGAGFRFVSPRFEPLNAGGGMRVDAVNADVVAPSQVVDRPEILKILFRGSREDLTVYERIKAKQIETVERYWGRTFGYRRGRLKFTGNGYQDLRESSRRRKHGDGLPGVSASYLRDLKELTAEAMRDTLVDVSQLQLFTAGRIHDPRSRELFQGPLLLVHKSPRADFGRISVAVSSQNLVFNETYYGYSAHKHPNGELLVRYLALIIGSKPALWLALITSGEFGFEREVVEKYVVDQTLVMPFEKLSPDMLVRVDDLFNALANARDDLSRHAAWTDVDSWVAELYGLHERDLQTIEDTLRFNLPFKRNRLAAQARPDHEALEEFCEALGAELVPWGERAGRRITVSLAPPLGASPWRSLQIRSLPAKATGGAATPSREWSGVLGVADKLAATEVVYPDPGMDCLWLARLNQARYWSKSQAVLAAQRIIWGYVNFLVGRPSVRESALAHTE